MNLQSIFLQKLYVSPLISIYRPIHTLSMRKFGYLLWGFVVLICCLTYMLSTVKLPNLCHFNQLVAFMQNGCISLAWIQQSPTVTGHLFVMFLQVSEIISTFDFVSGQSCFKTQRLVQHTKQIFSQQVTQYARLNSFGFSVAKNNTKYRSEGCYGNLIFCRCFMSGSRAPG